MRGRAAFALVAWAALAASARAAEEEPEPKQKPELKPVNPKVVLVVECARPADAKAARDFIAYITRKLPDKPTADDPTFVFMDPKKSYFEYSSCASLSAARKQAQRDRAFAIAHVKIISRRRTSRVNDLHETRASCTIYLPDAAKGGREAGWRVGKARMSPDSSRETNGPILLPWFPQPADPSDFTMLGNDLTVLLRDAAIEFRNPKAFRRAGGGHQIRAEVKNGTPFLLAVLNISLNLEEANGSTTYMVECAPAGGVPPGKQIVTADVTGDAVRILGAGNLQIRLESFRFQEAPAK